MAFYIFDPEHHKTIYERPWELRLPAFCVFGNLYFVGNKDGASWLLDTDNGIILFDTNYPTADILLLDSIWSLGFDPRSIIGIFHTHGHFDHFGSTALLKGLSGAKTYLGKGDAEMFRNRPELSLIDDGRHAYQEIFTPDVIVCDGDIFTFGNTTIRAVACPGHTPGTISYFFPVSDGTNTYMAGLHGGSGLNTLCKEFIQKYNVNWRDDFLESIKKIMDEPVDIFLGNHTRQNRTEEKLQQLEYINPFIDPSEWKRFLEKTRIKFEIMIEEELNNEV